MAYVKRFFVPVMIAATLLAVFARTAAVDRLNGTKVAPSGSTIESDASDRVADASASGFAGHGDLDMVRWIPIIVPAMALVLVTGIYLIYSAVL